MSLTEYPSFRVKRRHFGVARRPSAVVAIPARNEAEHIAQCLQALAAGTGNLGAVVLLNNCTDGSFEVARAAAERLPIAVRIYDGEMAPASSHAGGARRAAMNLAAEWLEEVGPSGGLLLTTDADSRPTRDWITANQAAIAKGVDAVAGRIELDPDDARALPAALHARGRLEAEYEVLVTELFARLDPRPHDPWPRHASEPGASLAVTLSAYRAVGGLPSMALGEDRALVAALERDGFRVRHDPAVSVVTSGRTVGRARGGVADTIRLRRDQPNAPCDPYLEPANKAYFRGLWRGKLRELHSRQMIGTVGGWARILALNLRDVGQLSSAPFAIFWEEVEARSPRLGRRTLRPDQLPSQILKAQGLLWKLRRGASISVPAMFTSALLIDTPAAQIGATKAAALEDPRCGKTPESALEPALSDGSLSDRDRGARQPDVAV